MENIDIDRLRNDLKDYYGTAAFNVSPVAFMDMFDIDNLSDEEVILKAYELNFDLDDYVINNFKF